MHKSYTAMLYKHFFTYVKNYFNLVAVMLLILLEKVKFVIA